MNRKQKNLYDIIQIFLFTFVIFSCRTLSTCISTFPHYHFWSFSKPALSLFIISKRKLLKNTLITISFYHTRNYLSRWDQISVWINFAHLWLYCMRIGMMVVMSQWNSNDMFDVFLKLQPLCYHFSDIFIRKNLLA